MNKINRGERTLEIMSSGRWYNKWIINKVSTYLKGQILEVGSGIGNLTKFLVDYGSVTASDIESKYLNRLRGVYFKSIRVVKLDVEHKIIKNKKYDVIICINVLEHIEGDKKALENIFKMLKKGGKLILLVPAHQLLFSEFDKSIGHYRRYSLSDVRNLVESCQFQVVNLSYINWWGAIGWFVFMRLIKNKKIKKNNLQIFDTFARIMLVPEKYIKPPFGLSVLAVAEKL